MIAALLDLPARYGRSLLVAGLAVGIALPGFAVAMKPWIPELIAVLLFLAAFRVGPRQAFGAAREIGVSVGTIFILQTVLPVCLALTFALFGWAGVLPTALVLMAAAAPVTGSPNLTIMTGNDPAPALRLLVIGTALLPLTVIPVFWLSPALGSGAGVLAVAGRLLAVIAVAVSAGFLLRASARDPSAQTIRAIDGLSAIVMAVVVIGLMSAVGPALLSDPGTLALNLLAAFAVCFGMQIMAATLLRQAGRDDIAVPLAILARNRNVALFLTALPAAVTDPMLLFIGCYQIPMYLTPILLQRFYREREKPE